MAVALGVADCLRGMGVRARVRWPNDVLVGGRKICGILAEAVGHGGVVVGVGLNVNMTAREAAAIDRPATSLRIEGVKAPALRDVLADCLACIAPRVTTWDAGGFAAIRAAWERAAVGRGEPVTVQTATGVLKGRLRGYGPDGELLLKTKDGRCEKVWSGDVTSGARA